MSKQEDEFIRQYVGRLDAVEKKLGYKANAPRTQDAKEKAGALEYRRFKTQHRKHQNRSATSVNATSDAASDSSSLADEYLDRVAKEHEEMLGALETRYECANEKPSAVVNLALATREFGAKPEQLDSCVTNLQSRKEPLTADRVRREMFQLVLQSKPKFATKKALMETDELFTKYEWQDLPFARFIAHFEKTLSNWNAFVESVNIHPMGSAFIYSESTLPDEGIVRLFMQYTQQDKKIAAFLRDRQDEMERLRERSHVRNDSPGPWDASTLISSSSGPSMSTPTLIGSSTSQGSTLPLFYSSDQDVSRLRAERVRRNARPSPLSQPIVQVESRDDGTNWEASRHQAFKRFMAEQRAAETASIENDSMPSTTMSSPTSSTGKKTSPWKMFGPDNDKAAQSSAHLTTSPTNTPGSRGVFTKQQLDFIESHWRPLRPMGQKTKELMGDQGISGANENITPAERFFYEAQLCAMDPRISSYEIASPALKDHYHGTIVLAKCNIPDTVLVLESGSSINALSPTVSNFNITGPRGENGATEGQQFNLGDYYFLRFKTKYTHEHTASGAFYFPDGPKGFKDAWLKKQTEPHTGLSAFTANVRRKNQFAQWKALRTTNPAAIETFPALNQIERDFKVWMREQREAHVIQKYAEFKQNFPAIKGKYTSQATGANSQELTVDQIIGRFTKDEIERNLTAKKQLIRNAIDEAVADQNLREKWNNANIEADPSPPRTAIDEFAKHWDSQKMPITQLTSMFADKAMHHREFTSGMNRALFQYGIQKPHGYIDKEFRGYVISTDHSGAKFTDFMEKSRRDLRSEAISAFNAGRKLENQIAQSFQSAAGEQFDSQCALATSRGAPLPTLADFLTPVSEKFPQRNDFMETYQAIAQRNGIAQNEAEWKKLFIDHARQEKPMHEFLIDALSQQAREQIGNRRRTVSAPQLPGAKTTTAKSRNRFM